MLARKTERDIERESKKSPLRGDGHVAILSPSFSSWDLGHARICDQHEFNPPGPGLTPRSTTWDSRDIAIMLTAGPQVHVFLKGSQKPLSRR